MPRRRVQVGEGGRTLGPLRPAGHVEVGGLRLEARSHGEFIPPDTPILVEKVEPLYVLVRPQRPDDSPLQVREDLDAEGRQEHAARLLAQARRRRKLREMLLVLVVGVAVGLLLYLSLRAGRPGRPFEVVAFLGWGAVCGSLYLAFLRLFLASAHDLVSENISTDPGVLLLLVLPLVGAFLGAVGGFQLGGAEGAVVGTTAVAFVLPPILCLAWRLLVTLVE